MDSREVSVVFRALYCHEQQESSPDEIFSRSACLSETPTVSFNVEVRSRGRGRWRGRNT